MICPNCGRRNVAEKNYCPSCGLKLEAIAQALAHEQSQPPERPLASARPPRRGGQLALSAGFSVFMLGTMICIIGGTMLRSQMVLGVGLLTMVLGMGSIGYSQLVRGGRSALPPSKTPVPPVPTNPLPTTLPAESIAEHTTRELGLQLERGEQRRPSKDLSLS